MTAPVRRRPLPALALIALLLVLTAVVWFRVIHRDSGKGDAAACPTPSTTAAPTPSARPTVLPYPSQVAVLLLNSTHRNGLAKQTRTPLHARGFKITGTDNDLPKYGGSGVIAGIAEIRYGKRAAAAATLLSYYFPKATMVATHSASTVVIVSLGRKFTALPSAATVRAELARAGAKLSRTGATPSRAPSPSASGC